MSEKKQYGLFTEQQRGYLDPDTDLELNTNNERRIKNEIRNRIDTLYAELNLFRYIPDEERSKIFENKIVFSNDDIEATESGKHEPGTLKREPEQWESGGSGGMLPGFVNMLGFTYKGLREQGYSTDFIGNSIKAAVAEGESDLTPGVDIDDVTVEFDVELPQTVEIEKAIDRFEEHGAKSLSAAQMKALVSVGVADLKIADE